MSEKEKKIASVIKDLNLLYQYPLSVIQVADWSIKINNVKPEMHIEDLERAMEKLVVGDLDFNPNIGIQNIFVALKSLERPMVY